MSMNQALPPAAAAAAAPAPAPAPALVSQPPPPPPVAPAAAPAAPKLRAHALYDYQAADDTELSFVQGEVIVILKKDDSGWWLGQRESAGQGSKSGLLPSNYVELIS
mmetsp:Transcript_18393/g.26726  ORF Transcript_18393/g.26726 Transcript_18393/m.26726 type:complete len:107 (-) Transcript_18393:128-448(-)